jgi:hypothetical protein
MQVVGDVTNSTFAITITKSDGSTVSDFGYEVPSTYYTQWSEGDSARYVFIALTIPGNLKGGSGAASVSVTYSYDTGQGILILLLTIIGIFKDLNNMYLPNDTTITGTLNAQAGVLDSTTEMIITALGILTSIFAVLGNNIHNY